LKILILKPSSLGDIVQALPVLRLLKKHFPASEIYWWIDSHLAPLLEGDPDLAGLVRFDRRRWGSPRHWGEIWRSVRWLRAQRFDWVIDLQSLMRSGIFAWLANGELLVGLDEPREGARGFYSLVARRSSFYLHAVDWYLEVLRLLDVPVHWNFQWLPPRPDVAAAVRRKWPVAEGRCIAIQPGARWPTKRWPAEHFAELIRRLAVTRPGARFAILGSEDEQELGATISRAAPHCLDLTGRLSLPEMVEWLRLSELMIANDTGPLHVAAALGTPVFALYGPTEPRRNGPYGQLDRVLQLDLPCVPCRKADCAYAKPFECLRGMAPVVVADAISRRRSRIE
jgi:lipopolysaccharide heptosyltransferase II